MGFTPIPSTSSGQALTFPCKGGRGLQGTAEMGSRMCGDNGGKETENWVRACARTTGGWVVGEPKVRGRKLSGMGFTPIPSTSSGQALTFPCKGGRGLQGTAKMGPRMRVREGRLCARRRVSGGNGSPASELGPRMREDKRTTMDMGQRANGGFPPPPSRGQAMREDKRGGRDRCGGTLA